MERIHPEAAVLSSPRATLPAFVALAFILVVQAIVLTLVPIVGQASGLTAAAIGVLLGLTGALGLLLDTPVARFSDARGRRGFIAIGGSLSLLACVLMAVAPQPGLLALGVLLYGISLAFAFGPAVALTTEISTPARQLTLQSRNGAAQAASALVGGWIAAAAIGLSSASSGLVIAALGSAGLAVAGVVARERSREGIRPTARDLVGSYAGALRLLRRRIGVRGAATIALLYNLVFLIMGNAFLPLFLLAAGYSAAVVGAVLSLRTGVMIVTSLAYPIAVGRWSLAGSAVSCQSAGAVGLGLLAWGGSGAPAVIAAAILLGIGTGTSAAAGNILVAGSTSTDERALGVSAVNLVSRAALLVLPVVMGVALHAFGFAAMFALAAIVAAGAVAHLFATVHGRRSMQPESRA